MSARTDAPEIPPPEPGHCHQRREMGREQAGQKLLNVKMSRGSEENETLGKASPRRNTKFGVLQVLIDREDFRGTLKYLI